MRHGQPVDESRGRCYGSLDLDLSREGISQVQNVVRVIPAGCLSAIYTSPRSRCVRSAELLASLHNCVVHPISTLAEIDFGEFEGRTYDEIARVYPDQYKLWMEHPTDIHFPDGESFTEMQQRVLETAEGLKDAHRGSSYAIVAHGGVNRIILANALGVANSNIFRIAQAYAAVNLIRYLGDYPSIELMNCMTGCL